MKTEQENVQFHAIGEKLQDFIHTALPNSGVTVKYNEEDECFVVLSQLPLAKRTISVFHSSACGALKDIGRFLEKASW